MFERRDRKRPGAATHYPWTEAELTLLRELRKDPANTAEKIAVRLGRTRNSVIGKIHAQKRAEEKTRHG